MILFILPSLIWNASQWVWDMCVASPPWSQGSKARQRFRVSISYDILMREGAWSHQAGQGDLAEVRDGWEVWEHLTVALHRGWASLEAQMVKESACNARDLGSIPGLGRCLAEGSWQPTLILLPGRMPRTEEPGGLPVHQVAKSPTQPGDEHFHFHACIEVEYRKLSLLRNTEKCFFTQ